MSILERTIQSVIFELGVILIGMLVIEFIPHEGQPLLLMILISLTAVIWNFIFNWIFDKLVPGDRLARGPVIRTIHAVLFEGLLLAATVPMIMYMMSITLWMAFITDISMILIILVYTYAYNWVYDRVRLRGGSYVYKIYYRHRTFVGRSLVSAKFAPYVSIYSKSD